MIDEFEVESLEKAPEGEVLELLSILEDDPDFQKELEKILEQIHNANYNLTTIQDQIIALLELSTQKLIVKEKLKDILGDLKGSRKGINVRIGELSVHLMMKRNLGIYISGGNVKEFRISKAYENLSDIMKRFIIYEIYKILTPRRIAGQTKLDNFIANFILRGEKVARKFEGGSDADIKKYSPQLIKKLRLKRKKHVNSGGGGKGIIPK